MILGLGIDLVETARIQASMDRFGDAFLERFLLPERRRRTPAKRR